MLAENIFKNRAKILASSVETNEGYLSLWVICFHTGNYITCVKSIIRRGAGGNALPHHFHGKCNVLHCFAAANENGSFSLALTVMAAREAAASL